MRSEPEETGGKPEQAAVGRQSPQAERRWRCTLAALQTGWPWLAAG